MAIVHSIAYGDSWLLYVDADPAGAGTVAPEGSLATDGSGDFWRCVGTGEWVKISPTQLTTTTSSIASSSSEQINLTGWFRAGLITQAWIKRIAGTSNSVGVEIYDDDGFSTPDPFGFDPGRGLIGDESNGIDASAGWTPGPFSPGGANAIFGGVPCYDADNTDELHVEVFNLDFANSGQWELRIVGIETPVDLT